MVLAESDPAEGRQLPRDATPFPAVAGSSGHGPGSLPLLVAASGSTQKQRSVGPKAGSALPSDFEAVLAASDAAIQEADQFFAEVRQDGLETPPSAEGAGRGSLREARAPVLLMGRIFSMSTCCSPLHVALLTCTRLTTKYLG